MSDLYNEFPSWGETGEYPPTGFFYEGGDQVNEKHLDALWNGVEKHVTNLNDAISNRVADIEGNLVLDSGLVASQGSTSTEVDVTATSLAYVDGERVTNVSSDTITISTSGLSGDRKDVVYLKQDGSIESDEGTTSEPAGTLKIAEVGVDDLAGVIFVDNYAQDRRFHTASENNDSTLNGDLWYDIDNSRIKVQQNGGFQRLLTEQNEITITAGDGLDGGASNVSLEDPSISLSTDVSDFADFGLSTNNSNDLVVFLDDFDGTGLEIEGLIGQSNYGLALDESVIKDGNAKEIDAAEFSGGSGSSDQVLLTDGSSAFWGQPQSAELFAEATDYVYIGLE